MNQRLCATILQKLIDVRERIVAANEAIADLTLPPTEGPRLPGSGVAPRDKEGMIASLYGAFEQKLISLYIDYYILKKQFYAAGCAVENEVWVIASHRVAKVNEPFHIKVLARSSAGVESVFWAGVETKHGELDEDHLRPCDGEKIVQETWGPFSIGTPGVYVFAAHMNDIAFGKSPTVAKCAIEIREDVSYKAQVKWARQRYARPADWETWMLKPEIKERYGFVWTTSRLFPTTMVLDFHYGTDAPVYDPAWGNDREHMSELRDLANFTFPGALIGTGRETPTFRNLQFALLFDADASFGDRHITVTGDAKRSHYDPVSQTLTLIKEPILGHELGHVFTLPHHYVGDDVTGPAIFMPPFEEDAKGCLMARTYESFCSGCRAALHIDTVDNSGAIKVIIEDIDKRYAPDYGNDKVK